MYLLIVQGGEHDYHPADYDEYDGEEVGYDSPETQHPFLLGGAHFDLQRYNVLLQRVVNFVEHLLCLFQLLFPGVNLPVPPAQSHPSEYYAVLFEYLLVLSSFVKDYPLVEADHEPNHHECEQCTRVGSAFRRGETGVKGETRDERVADVSQGRIHEQVIYQQVDVYERGEYAKYK